MLLTALLGCGMAPDPAPAWLACADPDLWWYDADGDGFGDASLVRPACDPPGAAYVRDGRDCDDLAAAANPDATEVCDALDDDCDGLVDAADPSLADAHAVYPDADGDGHGAGAPAVGCAGAGYSDAADDCDDADPGVSPDAIELAGNGVDDDCDGEVDEDDPGTTDSAPPTETGTPACLTDHLLISEVRVAATDGWFIELVNPTGAQVDLEYGTSLRVEGERGAFLVWYAYTWSVGPGEHMLFANGAFYPEPDIAVSDYPFLNGPRFRVVLETPDGEDTVCLACGDRVGDFEPTGCDQGTLTIPACSDRGAGRPEPVCDTDRDGDWADVLGTPTANEG